MPSTSKAQAMFFSAIAHGMKPRKGGPSVKVAKDFLKADEKKGKFEHSRHQHSKTDWKDSKPLHRATGGAVGPDLGISIPISNDHETQQSQADSQGVKPRHTPVVNVPSWKDVIGDIAARVAGKSGQGLRKELGPTDVYKYDAQNPQGGGN